jgi:carbon storage regulator
MLVLSRKLGEKIVIGDGITLTVVEIKGRTIRLGIEAPPSVPVWRGELLREEFASRAGRELVHAG